MWGVAVAMPYIFVANKNWKWYNQECKSVLTERGIYEIICCPSWPNNLECSK